MDKTREAYRSFRTVPAPRRGEILRQIREALAAKVLTHHVCVNRTAVEIMHNFSGMILVLLYLLKWVKSGQKVSEKFKNLWISYVISV